MVLALLTIAAVSLGGPDAIPQTDKRPVVKEVERATKVRLDSAATARYVPGRVGVEIDTALSKDAAERATESIPAAFSIDIVPIEGGTRIRAVHPTRRVDAQLGRSGGKATLILGAESEAARLRRLGALLALPFPLPRDLGPELELWQEAETTTAAGELERARELWNRLKQVPALDDLAAVRIAELYAMSGHINEATARLRAVSRRFPRSTGAALARLDLYHLEAITSSDPPTLGQVELAAQSGDRLPFVDYVGVRAAAVLEELGHPDAALQQMPDEPLENAAWDEPLRWLRLRLLAQAVAVPGLRGDPLGTAIGFAVHQADLADHTQRQAILRSVVDAQAYLGTFDDSIVLLRELLRSQASSADEADVVLKLADAYRGTSDLDRGAEVVGFAAARHPTAPGILARMRGLILQTFDAKGLGDARARIAELRGRTQDNALRRDLLALEADVVLAYGQPPAQVQALTKLREAGWDDPAQREPAFALALARAGRHADAAPLLRKWVGRTTDPEARDRLAYRLADVDLAQGRVDDAIKILTLIARSGTTFGRIARLRLRERTVAKVLELDKKGAKP